MLHHVDTALERAEAELPTPHHVDTALKRAEAELQTPYQYFQRRINECLEATQWRLVDVKDALLD